MRLARILAALSFIAGAALLASSASAAEARKAVPETSMPFLGPGDTKLSPEDYRRVYKNYIQTSILLGYPFYKEQAPPCDQALSAIFRGAGLYGYPVPSDAENLRRSTKTVGALKVETYQTGGILLQVARNKSDGLDRLVLINTSSTKAMRRLEGFAKNELLTLEKDPVTGLERVHKIPVGYPHPYLTKDGQGLFVKELRFNGKKEGCEPLDFTDNQWVGGFDLSDARCTDLQTDAEKVWNSSMSPDEFSVRELDRLKKKAMASAMAAGTKEAEAKALVDKAYQMPMSSQINIVGQAMRNLAQCNLLALGRAARVGKGTAAPGAPDTATPGQPANGAGSAQ